MERHFDQELLGLKRLITEMAATVEHMLAAAIGALRDGDEMTARAVVPLDKGVNQIELDVDEACQRLLALRQPLAVDLRTITGAMRIATDLERVGDLARGIARQVSDLLRFPPIHMPADLPRMADAARRMLHDAVDALLRGEADTAIAVLRGDDEVDELRTRLIRELVAAMRTDPEAIEAGVAYILVVRSLERIADHATNIAEDVVYIIRGEVVKHRKAAYRTPAPGA